MGNGSCYVRNKDREAKMTDFFGSVREYTSREDSAIEIGAAPQLQSVRTEGQMVNSPLYQDIYNELSHLNLADRRVEAWDIYTKAFSPEFLEEFGDWTAKPKSYSGRRYPETLEPQLDLLKKAGYIGQPADVLTEKLSASDKAIKFLEGTIDELKTKLRLVKGKLSNTDSEEAANRLKNLISDIETIVSKKEGKVTAEQMKNGIAEYLNYLSKDALPMYKEGLKKPENELDAHFLNDIKGFIDLHRDNLLALQRALKNNEELSDFYNTDLREKIQILENGFKDMAAFYEDNWKTALRTVVKKADPKMTDEEFDKWFVEGQKDIYAIQKWIGVSSTARDRVLKLVVHMMKRIAHEVHSIVYPKIENLKLLQEKLKEAGFETSVVNETYNGKKTGFLINKYKWGEYYLEEENVKSEILKKSGYDNWDAVIRALKEEKDSKDKPISKLFREEYKEFNKNYRKPSGTGGYSVDTSKFENKEFAKLMENKAFRNYYNALYDTHSNFKGVQPPAFRRGALKYMLPQIRNNELEAVKNGGVKEGAKVAKRKLKELARKKDSATTEADNIEEYGEVIRDKNGKILKLVPIHYNAYLQDQSELSDDITSMYHTYGTMAHNFKKMSESLPEFELIHEAMGKRKNKTPNSAEAVQSLINVFGYGEKVKNININLFGKKYDITKLADLMLVKYPSTINMAFNIPVTISGTAKTEIDTGIEAMTKQHITPTSLTQAEGELNSELLSILAEVGSKKKTNKVDMLLLHNGMDDAIRKNYRHLNIDTAAGRLLTSEMFYVTMLPFGYRAQARLMLGMYYNHRLVDGEFITEYDLKAKYKAKSDAITDKEWKNSPEYVEFKTAWKDAKDNSLYNAYEVIDGQVKVKKEYEKYITQDFEREFALTLEGLGNTLEGKRSNYDKGMADRTVIGRGVMMHRSWIPQLVSQRFKAQGYDYTTGKEDEGFYLTAPRVLWNMLVKTELTWKAKAANWYQLESYEKRNMIRFVFDTTALMALTILATVANKIADDDEEDIWFYEFLAYITNRLLLEQKALSPIPVVGGGVDEFFNITKSPLPGANQLQKLMDIGHLMFNFNHTIQSGAYKDKTIGERFLIQQSLIKNLYEIQNPKAKNAFLKSQILD